MSYSLTLPAQTVLKKTIPNNDELLTELLMGGGILTLMLTSTTFGMALSFGGGPSKDKSSEFKKLLEAHGLTDTLKNNSMGMWFGLR